MAMTNPAQNNVASIDPKKAFLRNIESWSNTFLKRMVGEERVAEAAGRLANAMHVIATGNAKILNCEPASVGQCIAMCALTGLMPGGIMPEVYLIPREHRYKEFDEQQNKEIWKSKLLLNWQVSYRGYQRLAERDGWGTMAIPVSCNDIFEIVEPGDPRYAAAGQLITGERYYIKRDLDHPPMEWLELRGVIVRADAKDGSEHRAEFVPRVMIEKRLRSSETFKKAVEAAAKAHDKIGPDDWRRKPSDAAWAFAEALSTEEVLRSIRGPWNDWGIEMCTKTALIYTLRRGIVPLSEVTKWATSGDERSESGHPPVELDAQVVATSRAQARAEEDSSPPALEAPQEPYNLRSGSGMDELMGDDRREGAAVQSGQDEPPQAA